MNWTLPRDSCCAPFHEESSKHHGQKGDPKVTPNTCGAIGERAFQLDYEVDAFQPPNLALEGAHSKLEFNQDSDDLAMKHKQIVGGKSLKMLQIANQCWKT